MAINRKLNFLFFFFLFLTSSSFIYAADATFSVDYVNRYIWRGFDLNPDNKYVIQPSIDFSFGDSPWTINLWHSYSAENKNLNELDITLNYDFSETKNVAISAGLVHYAWYWVKKFSEESNTSMEGYLSFTWEKAPLCPALTLYQDFKNGNGFYTQLALSKEISFANDHSLELNSTIGYNKKQWQSKSGFSDASVSVAVPVKSGKTIIKPYMGITWPLLNSINQGVAREYWLGVNFSFK